MIQPPIPSGCRPPGIRQRGFLGAMLAAAAAPMFIPARPIPAREEILDDSEAAAMLHREYRDGFELPADV